MYPFNNHIINQYYYVFSAPDALPLRAGTGNSFILYKNPTLILILLVLT